LNAKNGTIEQRSVSEVRPGEEENMMTDVYGSGGGQADSKFGAAICGCAHTHTHSHSNVMAEDSMSAMLATPAGTAKIQ